MRRNCRRGTGDVSTRGACWARRGGQKKFADAEPLILQGYEGIKDSAAAPAARKRELSSASIGSTSRGQGGQGAACARRGIVLIFAD